MLSRILKGLCLGLLASAGLAQSPDPGDMRDALDASLRRNAITHAIAVDPRINATIAADALTFVANFCNTDNSGERVNPCDVVFSDELVLDEIVGAFLTEALTGVPQIETLASRLARRTGHTIEDAGWPSRIPNTLGVIEIDPDLSGMTLASKTATGVVPIGSARKWILAPAGQAEFRLSSAARTLDVVLDVTPGTQIALAGGSAPARLHAGRIDVSAEAYCAHRFGQQRAEALSWFNWGRGKFAESEHERALQRADMAQQSELVVHVDDRTGACTEACKEGLGVAFVHAIAVWRSGCQACEMDALAVVRLARLIHDGPAVGYSAPALPLGA